MYVVPVITIGRPSRKKESRFRVKGFPPAAPGSRATQNPL